MGIYNEKSFFERNKNNTGYTIPDYMDTNNAEIYYANQAIDPWDDMDVSCRRNNEKKQFLSGQQIVF